MFKLSDDWKFLAKPRFWMMTFGNIGLTLANPAFATNPWYINLSTFIALEGTTFTAVQTFDRNFGDKKVEAAKIDAGYPPKEANAVV